VVQDQFRFMHQPMTGDCTITVHVAAQHLPSQERPVERGGKTITPVLQDKPAPEVTMIKSSAQPGAAYATIMVTSGPER
jgi:hypothetical protein